MGGRLSCHAVRICDAALRCGAAVGQRPLSERRVRRVSSTFTRPQCERPSCGERNSQQWGGGNALPPTCVCPTYLVGCRGGIRGIQQAGGAD